jgi:hypothetical protein
LFTVELVCSLLRQRSQRAELKVHRHRGESIQFLYLVKKKRYDINAKKRYDIVAKKRYDIVAKKEI